MALPALNHSIVSSGARFMLASTLHYGAPGPVDLASIAHVLGTLSIPRIYYAPTRSTARAPCRLSSLTFPPLRLLSLSLSLPPLPLSSVAVPFSASPFRNSLRRDVAAIAVRTDFPRPGIRRIAARSSARQFERSDHRDATTENDVGGTTNFDLCPSISLRRTRSRFCPLLLLLRKRRQPEWKESSCPSDLSARG